MLSYLIAASLSALAYPPPAVEVGRACPADWFSCGNGQCIAEWRKCDGLPDCGKPGEPLWGADESQWLAGCATAPGGDARLAQAVRNSAQRLELQLTAGPSGSYEDDDRERVRIPGGGAHDDEDRQVLGSGV